MFISRLHFQKVYITASKKICMLILQVLEGLIYGSNLSPRQQVGWQNCSKSFILCFQIIFCNPRKKETEAKLFFFPIFDFIETATWKIVSWRISQSLDWNIVIPLFQIRFSHFGTHCAKSRKKQDSFEFAKQIGLSVWGFSVHAVSRLELGINSHRVFYGFIKAYFLFCTYLKNVFHGY